MYLIIMKELCPRSSIANPKKYQSFPFSKQQFYTNSKHNQTKMFAHAQTCQILHISNNCLPDIANRVYVCCSLMIYVHIYT